MSAEQAATRQMVCTPVVGLAIPSCHHGDCIQEIWLRYSQVLALPLDYTSVESTVTHLSTLTNAKNGPSANTLIAKCIYKACKQHMCKMDIIVYTDRVNALNHTLMCQAVLFLSPQWFHWMTTFMCWEYICIHDMHSSCKAVAFEKAYYAHHMAHGLSEDDDVFLASLEPWLWISPSEAIIPDWEVHMDKVDKEMADEDLHWGSNDGEQAEGVIDKQVQAGHDFYTPDLGELDYPATGIGVVNKLPLNEDRHDMLSGNVMDKPPLNKCRHVPSHMGACVTTRPPLTEGSMGYVVWDHDCRSGQSPAQERHPLAKGYMKMGWPFVLNQQLYEGWMQPTMQANMENMQGSGLLMRSAIDAELQVVAFADYPLIQTMDTLPVLSVSSAATAAPVVLC
ncbi:hypothetical protein IW261DRAFT_1428050 [Armillaria novae-zelandiae]|uniref:Uncharacterized protein n=1 Tax=Armillaria novae-zelandiae TaxID=153914 RepID=A0AA39TKV5_9AGAR|nr:hypothetical protein IW261DRAFT_1428050 [Armillaria novae-zelandiae]